MNTVFNYGDTWLTMYTSTSTVRVIIPVIVPCVVLIFYPMHRVRTITKTVRYRRWGPKPRARIWNQYNRSGSDKKYYYELIYPNWDRGERWLNPFIHQFLNHAHWIILSILLILSTIMFCNIFFLFYISYCCDPMCVPLHPVYLSVFSHSPTYTGS